MKNKPRIIIHLISSLKIGGAESWLVDLISNMPDSIEHHVVYFYDGPNRLLLEQKGIKTYPIKGLVHQYDPFLLIRTYKLVKQIKPDLIHGSLWLANLVGRICAKLLHVPIVCSIHLGYDEDGPIRNSLDRYTLNWADQLIPVSQVVARSFSPICWIPAQKINPIANGIDINRIVPAQADASICREMLKIAPEAFVFGSVGRFIERKNYQWFITCFATVVHQHPNAHLLLLGLGPQENELRVLVKHLKLDNKVTFIIGQPAQHYLPLMDCFVLPSKQEGLSIALLEAMCHKKACIITSSDGQHDAIKHNQNGIIIPLEDESLINACCSIIENPELKYHISTNAFQTIEQEFNIERMVNHYMKVYEEILKPKNGLV